MCLMNRESPAGYGAHRFERQSVAFPHVLKYICETYCEKQQFTGPGKGETGKFMATVETTTTTMSTQTTTKSSTTGEQTKHGISDQ